MPDAIRRRGVPVASLDRLSFAAHANFRGWRGRSGEPRTLPAGEFDPGFLDDACQVAPVIAAIFVSPSLTVVIPTAAVAQGLGAIAVLAVVYRLEGPFSLRAIDWGEARKLLGYGGWMFATNVLYPRPRLRGSIHHWVGDGRRVGRSLCGADEPCPEERRHPGGVRAHPLSPYVQPVRRCGSRAGNARALNHGLWLRRHLRSCDDPLVDLLSLLDRR